MTETPDGQGAWAKAAADWVTIWQSELSAAAADQEPSEALAAFAALWEQGWKTVASLVPPPCNGEASRRAGTESPTRSQAAVAASDAGPAERIDQLARRVEELESKLAQLGRA